MLGGGGFPLPASGAEAQPCRVQRIRSVAPTCGPVMAAILLATRGRNPIAAR